ncbi:MAG: transcription elongation factor [Candidatus Cloacimonadota bacterium]|nr:MAG: transcription elongation factor [Candidatus Cloacimonadota bacterium]
MTEYITKEGMNRLQKRLNELVYDERPIVVQQIQTARELGDLKENAEYHAAREKQRHIDNEIGKIKQRMGVLKVIDPSIISKDAIRFGALVEVKEDGTDKAIKYNLIGVDEVYETDDPYTRISIASPIGRAMIGKKVGEKFIVKAPIGDRHFVVCSIK